MGNAGFISSTVVAMPVSEPSRGVGVLDNLLVQDMRELKLNTGIPAMRSPTEGTPHIQKPALQTLINPI